MLTNLLRQVGLVPGLLLALLLGGARPALATHLLGGEMTYRYLDNRGPATAPLRYEITVTVYNNCGSAGITSPRASASVGIYDQATGARIILTPTNYPDVTTFVGQTGMMSIQETSLSNCISPAIPPGCTISGVSQPYMLQKFVGIVNLPNTTKGYYALFTDSSRNVDVTNLTDPGAQAMTLYTAMAPPQLPNHSPVFSDIAVAIICANDTTFLLNNAVDVDGDRLVYSFGQPYAATGGLAILPTTSFTPPPAVATYNSGYSATTPFGSTKGNFAILNSSTGLAKYGAATAGRKYAVAVDVKEYRTIAGQEVLIGVTRRDLQLVVATCPATKVPVLPPAAVMPRDYTIEAGSTLSIPITATQADAHPLAMTLNSVLLDGAGEYNATLDGNPGTLLPGNPTGTAVVTGNNGIVTGTFVYAASCDAARTTPYDIAITVKDNGCAGKTIAEVLHITVTKPKGPSAISGDQLVCELNATRSYTASGGTAPQVNWRVTGGTIVGSPTANPVKVQWGGAGTGTVVARGITTYGCPIDSVTKNITISQTAALTITGKLTICQGTATTLSITGGTAPYTISGGTSVVTGAEPLSVSPTATTTYTITGAAAPNSCGAIGQVTVTVLPAPTAAVGAAARSTCTGVPIALGAAAVAGSTYSWSPTTGLSSSTVASPTLTLANAGTTPTTTTYILTETNATGCQTTNKVAITVNPLPIALTGKALTICPGAVAQLGGAPVAGYTYSWSPTTGLNSATAANPTVTLPNSTSAPITQTYTLTVTNSATGCVGTATVTVTVSQPPVAVPGAAATICSGSTAQLGAAPVAGYTYSWSPATGLSSNTVANPTVTLTNSTSALSTQIYTLTVTASSGAQCQSTATVTVTVNPLPVVTPGAATTICSGSTTQLGATPVAGHTYSWSPATGLSSTTAANPTVTLINSTAATTTQTYTLTATNSATGCSNTGTVAVTVNPAVLPGAISGSQTVCPGSSPAPFASTAGASGGTGTYTYQWESSPDNLTWTPIKGATNATYAPGPVNAVTYYRRQATAAACGTVVSNVLAVQLQTPLVSGVALATPPAQCAGTAFTFSPTPTNAGTAPTYRWFVNNILVATGATYTVSTLNNGDLVRVELTPTVGFCASGPATATVTVSLTPVAQPAVTMTLQTALPVCVGVPITFNLDKATNPGASPQYQWQVDGVNVAGAQAPVFTSATLRDGQTVTLLLRTTTACGLLTVASSGVRVSINPVMTVDAGPAKTIMEGDQIELEGTADGNYPVVWSPLAGLTFGSNPLRPVASPVVTTTYILSSGAGDCASSSPVTVTVTPRVRIPNAISPNGDGRDDTWEIDHIGDYTGNHVLVFNRWGSKIYEASGYSRGNEWNGTISGQPAPVGTYYYVITLGNGKSYSGSLTVVY